VSLAYRVFVFFSRQFQDGDVFLGTSLVEVFANVDLRAIKKFVREDLQAVLIHGICLEKLDSRFGFVVSSAELRLLSKIHENAKTQRIRFVADTVYLGYWGLVFLFLFDPVGQRRLPFADAL
jgi:hypothetical protein